MKDIVKYVYNPGLPTKDETVNLKYYKFRRFFNGLLNDSVIKTHVISCSKSLIDGSRRYKMQTVVSEVSFLVPDVRYFPKRQLL